MKRHKALCAVLVLREPSPADTQHVTRPLQGFVSSAGRRSGRLQVPPAAQTASNASKRFYSDEKRSAETAGNGPLSTIRVDLDGLVVPHSDRKALECPGRQLPQPAVKPDGPAVHRDLGPGGHRITSASVARL